jgi:hypothetical protein
MPRPFDLDPEALNARLDQMVDATFADLQSQFLVLPKGEGFIPYPDFQDAFEALKRNTSAFASFTAETVQAALVEDSLALVVLRTILGMSPPEWAELARTERKVDVDQGAARTFDTVVRGKRKYVAHLRRTTSAYRRLEALVSVAVECIARGAPSGAEDTVHRLEKFDTSRGLTSLQQATSVHVPYSVVLYERYLGRPFASHRDSVSGLVGEVMESAVEDRLARWKITYRKTKRAERVAGFEQAPDFFVPDEVAPKVVIEAKITSDDGTARDKVARILRLAAMRDERVRKGGRPFQLVACIDGRGFGVRRQDMKDMLVATRGKVFTLASIDSLIERTELNAFVPRPE